MLSHWNFIEVSPQYSIRMCHIAFCVDISISNQLNVNFHTTARGTKKLQNLHAECISQGAWTAFRLVTWLHVTGYIHHQSVQSHHHSLGYWTSTNKQRLNTAFLSLQCHKYCTYGYQFAVCLIFWKYHPCSSYLVFTNVTKNGGNLK